jgi:hypothetical protein
MACFNFLDNFSSGKSSKGKATKGRTKAPPAATQQAAVSAGWFVSTDDKWAAPYFDPMHYVDRLLFG